MKYCYYFYLFLLLSFAFLISGCGVNLVSATPTPELSAPPIEGESSAPPLESSLEEIIIKKNTPTGICVSDESNDILSCFDVKGNALSTLQVPGIGNSDPQSIHISGPFGASMTPPPVVYLSWEPEQALLVSENGLAAPLRKTSAFLALTGAVGQPDLAFSEVDNENNFPHSYLFTGNLQTLGKAVSFYDLKDAETGMALMPVAVEANGTQAKKIWYTHTAWGIGGADLIYPINRGLSVFDLETSKNTQALGNERNFQGLSPDKTLAGSISFDIKDEHSMRVTDLVTGYMVNFPLNLSSDRGAGYAVFSIDGKYAAWLESSGSMVTEPVNFQTLVRIGDIETGAVTDEIDSILAAQVLGWERVSFMKPVGWMNSQTLVIEARGSDWKTATLIKYDTSSANLTVLCEGSFAGFSYP
jgi:hypothetical protein